MNIFKKLHINIVIAGSTRNPETTDNTRLRLSGRNDRTILARLCGSKDTMRMRMRTAFSSSVDDLIDAAQQRSKKTWILLILAFALVLVFSVVEAKGATNLDVLHRDSYNGSTVNIPADINASYKGAKVKSSGSLLLMPQSISAEEIAEKMDALEDRLPAILLSENASLLKINSDLHLPEQDPKTGIDITWESDEPAIISSDGNINMVDGKAGDEILLSALLRFGEAVRTVEFELRLCEPAADYDYTADLRDSVARISADIAENSNGDKIKLPKMSAGGAKLKWTSPGDFAPLAAPFVIVLIGVVVYRRRYHWLNVKIKVARESVASDFPGFINKLILLLNAGMVISSAIAKIADDYRAHKHEDSERYFYEELCGMEGRIRSSNSVLATEFSDLANRTQRREVMRFASLLSGSLGTGTSLAERLDRESSLLWEMRKKNAEEKGRVAESKLTFPMVLQLLAIILITVAPAAMSMQ